MKNLTIFFILIILSICTQNVLLAQSNTNQESFNIIVQNEGDQLMLTCNEGCAWEKLNFTLLEGTGPQYVDKFGMTTAKGNKNASQEAADFLISFERKGNQINCTGKQGTKWGKLSFSCSKSRCYAKVDMSGVEVLGDAPGKD